MKPILLFLSACVVLLSCNNKQPDAEMLLGAVPLKTSVLIQFQSVPNGLQRFGQTALGGVLDSLDNVQQWAELLGQLAPLAKDTSNNYRNLPAFACVHLSGGQKFEVLWLVPESLLAKFKDFAGYQLLRSRDYGGSKILVFKAADESTFAASRIKNVLALSTSEILVEEAIKQMDATIKITANHFFTKAYASCNKRDHINVLVNFSEMPEFAKWAMPQTGHDWMRQFSQWAALDVDLKYEQVLFNGITLFNDSTHDYLATFKKNGAQTFEAPEIFPVQTAAFVAIAAENFPQYQRAYLDFLSYHNKTSAYKRHQLDFGFDAAELLATHINNEWGIFYPESKSGDVFGNKFGYFESNNIAKTQEALLNVPNTDLLEYYRDVPIYRFGAPSFLPHTLGQLFWGLNDVYLVFWKNYVVFGSSFGQVKGLINDWQDGKTLDQDPSFKAFAKEFSSKGNIWAASLHPAGLNYSQALFSPKIVKNVQQCTQQLAAIKYVGIHMRATDQAGITTIIAKHETKSTPDTRRRWTALLAAPVDMQPVFVTNHNNGLQEIFVQDTAHNVYLIDGTGQILWQRPVSGKILGPVTQVDLFKNNKLQLAFNTANKLYVIDRNGQDVRPFPIAFPEPATAGAGVFDYDNTKNYRFVVPIGNKLLNYGADAMPVAGWENPVSATPVMQTPQHIRIGAIDYILAITRGGQIRLLNRKGEDRVTVPGNFPLAQKPLYLQNGNSPEDARLVGLTVTGKLINIYFDGKADSLDAGLGSAVSLYMQDNIYLLAGKRKLQLREPNNPFEVTTPSEITIGPFLFLDGENRYCGAGAVKDQQIYLYDMDGKMLPGFPVYGASPFAIGAFRPVEPTSVIVGTPDGSLVCYRLHGQ